MSSILIADDEKNMLVSLKAILQDEGYETHTCDSGEAALDLLSRQKFDVLITDLKMSGMTGLALLQKINETRLAVPVILITAYATPKSAVEAIKSGAFDYIPKPFDPEEMLFSIRKAFEFSRMQKENIELKESLQVHRAIDEIIGDDASIGQIKELIEQIAKTKATVLVQGESGTGKELVAKAIHEIGNPGKKFIAVNCAAIPDPLLESELFGHERGAFTGAIQQKKGKFEIAEDGTLYLDEIGDMSLSLQAKILRVLEDGRFERVGGNESIQSQSRVIAATNKDLKKAIQEGQFREDLFFRLNVINIQIPPLRDRVPDIRKLAMTFLRKFSLMHSREMDGIHSEALKKISSYRWPGNVRELRNIIERCVLLERSHEIQLSTLPPEIVHAEDMPERSHEFEGGIDFKIEVDKYERQMIEWALKKSNQRTSDAARLLGLSRHSMRHYMLKIFGKEE